MDKLNERGQSIVETVLMLPYVLLACVVFFQLLFFCRGLLLMQRMAYDASREAAVQAGAPDKMQKAARQGAWLGKQKELWNLRSLLVTQLPLVKEHPLAEGKPNRGIETNKIRPGLTIVELRANLVPHLFMRWFFGSKEIRVQAGFPEECPLP